MAKQTLWLQGGRSRCGHASRRSALPRATLLLALLLALGSVGILAPPVAETAGIPTGADPIDTVIRPDGQVAYVLNDGDSTVTVADPATHSVIAVISLGQPLHTCKDLDWSVPLGRLVVGCTNGNVLLVDPATGQVQVAVNTPGASYGVLCADNVTPGVLGWAINTSTGWLTQLVGGVGLPILALPFTTAREIVEKKRPTGAPGSLDSCLYVLGAVGTSTRVVGFDRATMTPTTIATIAGPAVPLGIDTTAGSHAYVAVNVGAVGQLHQLQLSTMTFTTPSLSTYTTGAKDVTVAGTFVFALVATAAGGSEYRVYDAGDPLSVLFAGTMPAGATAARGGASSWMSASATLDDAYLMAADTTTGATDVALGESRASFLDAAGPQVLEVEPEITDSLPGIFSQEAVPCTDCPKPEDGDASGAAGDGYATPTTAQTAASVQYATGEEVYRLPILHVPGVGPDASVELTYRSRRHYDYRYGNGWFLNQDQRFYAQPNGDERHYDGRGRRDTYTLAPGGYVAPRHFDTTLQVHGTSRTVTNRRGDWAVYSGLHGTRSSYTNRYNDSLTYTWSATQLQSLTDALGRTYTFAYNAQGRLSSVTDFGGRTTTLGYDYLGQLRKVTRPASTQFPQGRTTWFSYSGNAPDVRLRSNLVHVWTAKGNKVQTLTYDSNDLITGETLGTGSYAIAYDPVARTRTVLDRALNTTTFTFDANAMVTSVERFTKGLRSGEPTSYLTTYTMGSNGYPQTVVYPKGNRSDVTYDANFNVTQIRRRETNTSVDAPSDLVTTRTYGAYSQLVSVTDPRGNTTNFTVDASGNTTHVVRPTVTSPATQTSTTQLTYDTHGRLLTSTDGEARATSLEYYTSGPMNGYLRSIRRDPTGTNLQTVFEYDVYGGVTAITDPRGARTSLSVDTEGYVTEATLPAPYAFKARFTYDLDRNVTRLERQNVDRKGVEDPTTPWIDVTATHDALGRVLTTTARLTASVTATTSYQYDGAGQLLQVTTPEGNATRYEYDERQLPFRVTRGLGTSLAATTRFDYDANGQLETSVDPRGNSVSYLHDAFGRTIQVTNELGHYVRIAHDAAGNPTTVEAKTSGGTVMASATNHYDEVGRLWKTVASRFGQGIATTTPTVIVARDRTDRVTAVTDALGRTSLQAWDALGRLLSATDAMGNQVAYDYDGNGNVTRVRRTELPAGGGAAETFTTEFVYDELNRLRTRREIDRISPTNVLLTNYEHDSRGNLTFAVDAEGHPTRWTYDLADRLLKRERALSIGAQADDFLTAIEETFAYDSEGRLTQLRDDNYQATAYGFDALNRVTTTTYADTRSTASTFDLNGNVLTWTDQNGTVVSNTYDARNRLTARSVARGTGVQGTSFEAFTYDALDRLLTAVDDDTRVENTWDSVGNLLQERQGYNVQGQERWQTIVSTWSEVGMRTGLLYPSGFALSHVRDAIDRLTALVDVGASQNVATFTWQGAGRLQRTNNQNGTATEYAYDGFARVSRIDHLLAGGAGSLHRMDYLYDRAHNRRMEQNSYDAAWVATLPTAIQGYLAGRSGTGDVYAYDWAYRLVDARYDVTNPQAEVASPGTMPFVRLVQYTLDGLGNRSQVATTLPPGGLATVTYATDVVNQYTAVGGVTRGHDSNGNVADDGTKLFKYDYRNHLTEVVNKSTSATIATYKYDALGRRIEKAIAGGATTRYLLDGPEAVEEVSGTDVWQARYLYEDGIDVLRAMDRADMADVDADGNSIEVLRFNYHQSALGSVTEVSAPSGVVVEWAVYDAYGASTLRDRTGAVVPQSVVGNRYLFTGREYDGEAGLHFYRARSYDVGVGRFLQRDPAGYVGGLSLYSYVEDAPVSLRDPSGRDPYDLAYWRRQFNVFAQQAADSAAELQAANDALATALCNLEVLQDWLDMLEDLLATYEFEEKSGCVSRRRAMDDLLEQIEECQALIDARQLAVDTASDRAAEARSNFRQAWGRARWAFNGLKRSMAWDSMTVPQLLVAGILDMVSGAAEAILNAAVVLLMHQEPTIDIPALLPDNSAQSAGATLWVIASAVACLGEAPAALPAKPPPRTGPSGWQAAPRPPGVPDHWPATSSKSGGGTVFRDPSNAGNAVRVMPGSPKSPYPKSQKPYIRATRDGQYLDSAGNTVPRNSPDGHIPAADFTGAGVPR